MIDNRPEKEPGGAASNRRKLRPRKGIFDPRTTDKGKKGVGGKVRIRTRGKGKGQVRSASRRLIRKIPGEAHEKKATDDSPGICASNALRTEGSKRGGSVALAPTKASHNAVNGRGRQNSAKALIKEKIQAPLYATRLYRVRINLRWKPGGQ